MKDLTSILIVFGVVLVSMIVHEIAHGAVAYFLGDDTAKNEGRLTFNPFKHIDPIMSLLVPMLLYLSGGPVFGGAKPVPIDKSNLKYGEWGMAAVAFAGPVANLLIALTAFLVGHFTGLIYGDGFAQLFFVEAVLINLGFMVFNLIPVPPLDGSRILYAIAPDGVRAGMVRMESMGIVVIYIMILLFGSAFSRLMSWGITSILSGFYWLVGM